jgi:sialate O-acetylesterase
MKNKILFLSLFFLCVGMADAKLKLPAQISSNMVLQQQTKVCLWGEATPNATVTITTSWSLPETAKAGADGKWTASIETPEASFMEQDLLVSDGDSKVLLKNILIGEVWFCSGQSNMEMPLNGFGGCPILNANNLIADAPNHVIRMATIEKKAALTPQPYANGEWKTATPDNAQWFSATAYNFALGLQRTLQVPIGIINCSWGGSHVEGWLPKEILQGYPDIDISKAGSKQGLEYDQPMIMYNGMLAALTNYTVKGFIWYQGEGNVGHADTYAERLATMVKLWRSLWGLGDLPFYYVEIAPYRYENDNQKLSGALLREAQFKAQALIPNSAMITTNDLVKPFEATQIHPANKTDVGERLAYQALNKTYGIKGIEADGPIYQKMEIKGNAIEVTFSNASSGFSPWLGIEGFEIAGADKVFHPARARLSRGAIVVSSEEVPAPVAVRYCFRNFQIGNLTGARNLPVIPFRTDAW